MKFTPKVRQAATEFARGRSPKSIAAGLEVTERSVRRWMADPEFQALVDEIRAKDAEKVAERWAELSAAHLNASGQLREIIVERLQEISDAQSQGEKPYHAEVKALAEALKDAIAIEREAASMEFRDHNRAIQHVIRLGFIVKQPDGKVVTTESP